MPMCNPKRKVYGVKCIHIFLVQSVKYSTFMKFLIPKWEVWSGSASISGKVGSIRCLQLIHLVKWEV